MRPNTRCAVYTRKSSEEGLEQSFNSLHAQREACEAYVLTDLEFSACMRPYKRSAFWPELRRISKKWMRGGNAQD